MAYWANEKRAFGALRHNKGMIQCLGHFSVRDSAMYSLQPLPLSGTMNILLEYGRFALMGVFLYRFPPVSSSEIEGFWRSLIEVVDALKGIHDIKTQNGRWHG